MLPGYTPVVFTRVHVFQMPTHGTVTRGYIFFFDVCVKCIEQNTCRRMANLVAERSRLVGRVEEVRFEPV